MPALHEVPFERESDPERRPSASGDDQAIRESRGAERGWPGNEMPARIHPSIHLCRVPVILTVRICILQLNHSGMRR